MGELEIEGREGQWGRGYGMVVGGVWYGRRG